MKTKLKKEKDISLTKNHFCKCCGSFYIGGRPFICNGCNSNVFLVEMDISEDDVLNIGNPHIKIIKDYERI